MEVLPAPRKRKFYPGLAAFNASLLCQALYPLEVVKIRMQSHDGIGRNLVPKYSGIFDALCKVTKEEGISGLFRGVFFHWIAQTVSNVLFFQLYESRKEKLLDIHHYKPYLAVLRASTEASLVSVFATQPLWVIKTRRILNYKQKVLFPLFPLTSLE